jgi:hypothetical protein
MPLRYLLDEHLRGVLWRAIQRHNTAGSDLIDAVQVGDPPDLPLGSLDPDILVWAEREGRIVVTRDRRTMPVHFANHLQAGRHSPGIFVIRKRATLVRIILDLALKAHASHPIDWQDAIGHIP